MDEMLLEFGLFSRNETNVEGDTPIWQSEFRALLSHLLFKNYDFAWTLSMDFEGFLLELCQQATD